MPKKKSKDKELSSDPAASNHLNPKESKSDVERSRSTTPSQSRPESRITRDKPSGLAELFGIRSSRRSKSIERQNSNLTSSDGSKKKPQPSNRPVSMENPMKQTAAPKQEEFRHRQSLSNYFSQEQSHSPIPHSYTEPDLNTSQESNRSTRQFMEATVALTTPPDPAKMMLPTSAAAPGGQRKEVTPPRDINQVGLPVPPVSHVMNSTLISASALPPPGSLNSSLNTSNQPSSLNTSFDNRDMSLPLYPPPANPSQSMMMPEAARTGPALDTSVSSSTGPRRQTGRQSGRFKRSGGGNTSFNNTSANNNNASLNTSFVSQGSNEAQSRFMDSLVRAPPMGQHQQGVRQPAA
eukprot:TRINITY_DN59383_c0_g1_i1.p1 TRINITY_DN59383_c0_g1~~TRINITY_DN59383_c0_g1_i1.p1  ORF type:complete len:367 (-),score=93.62 TRINITY_DN59383_c0_g1_i1:67-1119(-)